MSYPYHPRVGFSVSRSFPSCFACGHSLLPVQPSPKGEEWKVGSEKQARILMVNFLLAMVRLTGYLLPSL